MIGHLKANIWQLLKFITVITNIEHWQIISYLWPIPHLLSHFLLLQHHSCHYSPVEQHWSPSLVVEQHCSSPWAARLNPSLPPLPWKYFSVKSVYLNIGVSRIFPCFFKWMPGLLPARCLTSKMESLKAAKTHFSGFWLFWFGLSWFGFFLWVFFCVCLLLLSVCLGFFLSLCNIQPFGTCSCSLLDKQFETKLITSPRMQLQQH